MSRIVCLNCGSADLERRRERHFEMTQRVLASGKLSKKEKFVRDSSASEPEWVLCNDCNSEFDYGIDEKGRIELYNER